MILKHSKKHNVIHPVNIYQFSAKMYLNVYLKLKQKQKWVYVVKEKDQSFFIGS